MFADVFNVITQFVRAELLAVRATPPPPKKVPVFAAIKQLTITASLPAQLMPPPVPATLFVIVQSIIFACPLAQPIPPPAPE
jgi:hypothetical protein